MPLEKSVKCEDILQYTEGIKTISNQVVKTKKCTFDAHYKCRKCSINLCEYHAIANRKYLYCKTCHPIEDIRNYPELILVE